jgi:hypothetical protein
VIVFHREGTLDLTYRHITAKREKDPIFDLKVILLCTALAAVLGSSRAQEKTDQRHPARQPNYHVASSADFTCPVSVSGSFLWPPRA